MDNRYCTANINQRKAKAKRRKILMKRIRCACSIIEFISLFYILGIVGGLENDNLTIGGFIVRCIVTIIVILMAKFVNSIVSE